MSKLLTIRDLLTQPLPEDFDWTFIPVFEKTANGACGCAIGLGVYHNLLPHPDELSSPLSHFYSNYLETPPEAVEAIFFLYHEDEHLTFTPELVVKRIDAWLAHGTVEAIKEATP